MVLQLNMCSDFFDRIQEVAVRADVLSCSRSGCGCDAVVVVVVVVVVMVALKVMMIVIVLLNHIFCTFEQRQGFIRLNPFCFRSEGVSGHKAGTSPMSSTKATWPYACRNFDFSRGQKAREMRVYRLLR